MLAFGGSLGAEKLNNAMIGVIKKLAGCGTHQIIFGTGDRNYDNVKKVLADLGVKEDKDIRVLAYINNMSEVMAAADLVVSRAGAITLSEIAALGKPSILIPSPNVVRNHQEQNARTFESAGGAVVITEDILSEDHLYDAIVGITGDAITLSDMSEAVGTLAKCDALDEIYSLLKKISK